MGGVQGGRGVGGKVNLPPLQRFNTRRWVGEFWYHVAKLEILFWTVPAGGRRVLAEGCRLETQCSRKGSFEKNPQKNNGGSRLILRQTTPYGVHFFLNKPLPAPLRPPMDLA